MAFIEVRWILRDTEPLGKVGRVSTSDIVTVNGNADRMEPEVMPGDIITVREQPDTVAGAVVLRSSVPVGKRPLSAVAQTAELAAKKRKCKY
jgi:hypothetical protein